MTDERTISFQRGLETWDLNVRFTVQELDPSIGDGWGASYLEEITFLNPNTALWVPFALSEAEFDWLEAQVQP